MIAHGLAYAPDMLVILRVYGGRLRPEILMKRLILLFTLFAAFAAAQTTTTLTAPVNAQQGYVMLASTTGITGQGNPVSQGSLGNPNGYEFSVLYIGTEMMRVTGPPGPKGLVSVERGWRGTGPAAYTSGTTVTVSNTSLPTPNGFPVHFMKRPAAKPKQIRIVRAFQHVVVALRKAALYPFTR